MMDYAPLRDSARRARQQHTAAAYEASLRQALSYAPVPTGPGGGPRTPTPGAAGAPFVPPPSSHEAPPSPPPRDDLRQSLVRAQQNAQAQLQALVLHQRQLAAALRDLAEGAVPRAEHACRVAGRRGDDAVAAANTVRRELAEQQTQNDAQQRHVRQSIAALRLALDERPTQRQCADLASQTVARWVESDPGAEAWVRRAARSAVGAALGDGGALSAELEDRVARAARTAAAQAAERAAKEIVDKGDFLREAVEAVAQRAGGRVWGDNHKATLRDECAGVAARAASDAVERLVAEYGDRTGAKVAAALEEARVHARAGKEHRDQSAHLLEGATASLAALRKRVDDVDRRHAATHGESAANVEATLAALLVRLESVERQAPNDPGQPLRALEARLALADRAAERRHALLHPLELLERVVVLRSRRRAASSHDARRVARGHWALRRRARLRWLGQRARRARAVSGSTKRGSPRLVGADSVCHATYEIRRCVPTPGVALRCGQSTRR